MAATKCPTKFAAIEAGAYLGLVRRVIAAHADGKNLIMSPLSIHLLLAMTAAGSSGATLAQLLSYLRCESLEELTSQFTDVATSVLRDGSSKGGPVLSTKNGLWVDRSVTLKPAFQDVVVNSYNAVAERVDFRFQAEEAAKQVNAWAEKETNGLIKHIIPPHSLSNLTRLVMANAIYFKGAWIHEFEASRTNDLDFFLLAGTPIKTPFMSSYSDYHRVQAFQGFKVLQLGYKAGTDNRSFSMIIYLPEARNGLPELTERFCSEPGFIDSHLPAGRWLDVLLLPKFKIGFEFEASEDFNELGLDLPFDEGNEEAGMDEMVESRYADETRLFVANLRHKAFVEVNEEGTEAAAVTEAEDDMGFGLVEEVRPRFEFVADHPFMFVIREDTSGVVIFVGQLHNPLAKLID